uniref:Uncharacterized protein n=1 Tax=Anguilla anguilla TaxID=7936 RepID=A0A0E9RAV1_ANGAN
MTFLSFCICAALKMSPRFSTTQSPSPIVHSASGESSSLFAIPTR